MSTPPAAIQGDIRIRVIEAIGDVAAADWNALGAAPYPFLRHEFLAALESEGCLGERFGWLPRHLTLWRDGRLEGAVPLYLKFNSYGEFVFDWSWADAYQRNGLKYYPKLVSASPYTPATGPKLLLRPDAAGDTRELLIAATQELAKQSEVSSLHCLFTTPADRCARIRRTAAPHRLPVSLGKPRLRLRRLPRHAVFGQTQEHPQGTPQSRRCRRGLPPAQWP